MPDQSVLQNRPLRDLANRGLLRINDSPATADATLVVVGVARGGTSLAAGVLHALGVFLGDESHAPVYEDLRLSRAFEENDSKQTARVIAEYDSRYSCWGWKRPGAINYLERVHARLRNPRYLVVFKDIFSIANRNCISMSDDAIQGMRRALDEYQKVLDFLHRRRPPALLVSYDKALRDKEAFVDAVIGFGGLMHDPAARERALAFITPDPEAYLEATRADRVVGHLDVVTPREVIGWAALAVAGNADPAPLPVELWINGARAMSVNADLFRADLKQAGVHPSGKAGYRFLLPEQARLRPADSVRVFAGIERTELKNSPWTVAE